MAKSGDFHGHQRGPQLAITEDFLMAMDRSCGLCAITEIRVGNH